MPDGHATPDRVQVGAWTCAYCGVTKKGRYEVTWREDGKVFCSFSCEIRERDRIEREATR